MRPHLGPRADPAASAARCGPSAGSGRRSWRRPGPETAPVDRGRRLQHLRPEPGPTGGSPAASATPCEPAGPGRPTWRRPWRPFLLRIDHIFVPRDWCSAAARAVRRSTAPTTGAWPLTSGRARSFNRRSFQACTHARPSGPAQCRDRRPRRPRQDDPGRRHALAVGRVPGEPGRRRPGHGLDRPGAGEGHHHPGQEHGRELRRREAEHRRHPRPRRLRRRGGAGAGHGRRRPAPGRRGRGPPAPDPLRAPQDARGPPAGDPGHQQGRPARRPGGHTSSTRSTSCSSTSTPTTTRSSSPSSTPTPGTAGRRSTPAVAGDDRSQPLFQLLVEHIPAPTYEEGHPLQALVTNLDRSPYLGRLAMCRVRQGTITRSQIGGLVQGRRARSSGSRSPSCSSPRPSTACRPSRPGRARSSPWPASPDVTIGETLADPVDPRPLPVLRIDEPSLSMTIGVNTSPLAGQGGGTKLTARLVKSRLDTELVGNVSLRVFPTARPDTWEVQGRGELQLAVLVETMRREGFELTVGKPQVVTREIDGKLCEPVERMTVFVPEDHLGAVHQAPGRPQGPGGAAGEPRPRLGPHRVPRAGPGPHRVPDRVHDRDPGDGHPPPRLRALRALVRRDPHPQQRVDGGRPAGPEHHLRPPQPLASGARC